MLKKRSPWKRPHDATERPFPTHAGALIQLDTVHIHAPDGTRFYAYTLIDLFSRWAYAEVVDRISAKKSVGFVIRAQKHSPFQFGSPCSMEEGYAAQTFTGEEAKRQRSH